MVFFLIILGLPVLNIAWWVWADWRLRGLAARRKRGQALRERAASGAPRGSGSEPVPFCGGRPGGIRPWRWLLAAFAGGNLAIFGAVLLTRRHGFADVVPTVLLTACYVWHLVVLPATVLILAGGGVTRLLVGVAVWITRALRARQGVEAGSPAVDDCPDPADAATGPRLTRRQVLAAAAVALPPAATVVGQIDALWQLDTFRIRRLEIGLPALPVALDGLTIAHVSDVHVGRFTNGAILDEVVARTNALRPELVLVTGDLIDHALADLPAGLDMLRQLEPRERLFMCEGNHDLFEGREAFERRVRAAGVPLLLNESAVVELRGESVQMLGLRWGRSGGGRGAWIDEQMARVLPLRRAGAFTILLAHHPHAFDPAAEAGIPLTLSGHTHGGQLMLTDDIGAGPLLFKYCSGLYRKGPAALVVSNGVGNWFPLRVNAPAEILHLTLRATGATT